MRRLSTFRPFVSPFLLLVLAQGGCSATGGSSQPARGGSGGDGTPPSSGTGGQTSGASGGAAGNGPTAGTGGNSGTGGAGGGAASSAGASGAGPGGTAGIGPGGRSGSGLGGAGGVTLDVFGIRRLYPSAASGSEWTSTHWDKATYVISARRDPNDPSGLSGMRGTGTLQVSDGTLVMAGSQPRLYVYPRTDATWRDVEITVYYQRVTDSNVAYAGLVVGARSGPDGHTDSNACDAHTYYARLRNDGAFDFEKELEHPASATQSRVSPATAWPPDGAVPRGTWLGFKYVIYNVAQSVALEAYRDMAGGANGGDWQLVNRTVDDGGWSVETVCDEHGPNNGASDLVVLAGGTVFIRNTDVTEARYRWISIREIAPQHTP